MKFSNLPKICVTIGNLESIEKVQELSSRYAFVELRADTITGFYNFADKLQLSDTQVLITDYSKDFDPEFIAALPYVSIVTLPETLGYERVENLVKFFREKSILTIAAYHSYKPIMDIAGIKAVYEELQRTDADLIKIVITATNFEDIDTVLNLYENKPDNLIAFAMGSISFSSRIRCLGLGAPFTFAHADELPPFSEGQQSNKIMHKLIRTSI